MRPADFLRARGIHRYPNTVFIDGSSHYDTPLLGNKYTSINSTNCTWAVVPGEGRAGRGCIRKTATNNGDSGYLTASPLRDQNATWVQTRGGTFGHALEVDDLSTVEGGLGRPGVFTISGGLFTVTNGVWTMFAIGLNPNGTLSAYVIGQPNGGLIATSIGAVGSGNYQYLEYEWLISTDAFTADGTLEIRWNSLPILTYTGVLSPFVLAFPLPTAKWQSVTILGTASVPGPPFLVMRQGDAYLNDNVASIDPANPADSFFGDVPVKYIIPDGIGNSSGWTPSTPPNFSCVNEVPPDDAEQITGTAVGTRDTYEFEDVVGDPKAIQICILAKKATADAARVMAVTRQGGNDFDGPPEMPIGDTSYDYLLQPQNVNPDTGLQYTEAEMNAGEWGVVKTL